MVTTFVAKRVATGDTPHVSLSVATGDTPHPTVLVVSRVSPVATRDYVPWGGACRQ